MCFGLGLILLRIETTLVLQRRITEGKENLGERGFCGVISVAWSEVECNENGFSAMHELLFAMPGISFLAFPLER